MDQTILDLEKAAMERWRNGDPFGFVELTSEEICYIDPSLVKPIMGLGEFRKFMQQIAGKVHYQRSEFIEPRVVTVGQASLLTYNYRSSVINPDGEVASHTPWNVTTVYYRQKIVHSHFSFVHHRVPEVVDVPITMRPGAVKYEGLAGELMSLETHAMHRWRQGDPWGFIELYAPDVTYFDTGTPQRINGIDALRTEYQLREGKIFFDVMDFIDPCVQVYGDLAVLFYRFFSTRLNPDGSIASRIPWNCTEVYTRVQSSWKIIHNHWSHIRGERY